MKEKGKAKKEYRVRGKVIKKIAAEVRWAVLSWLSPAGSEARWEQNRCPKSPARGKS